MSCALSRTQVGMLELAFGIGRPALSTCMGGHHTAWGILVTHGVIGQTNLHS
jgi:hypothetical protein